MDDPRTYGNRTKPPNRRRKRSPGILLLVAAAASGLFLSTLLREQQSPLFVSSLSLPSSSSLSSSKPFSRPEEPTSTTRTIGAAREATTNTNNVSIGIGIGIGLSRRDLLGSTTKSGFVTMAIAGGIMVPWLVSTEAAQAASEGIGRGPIAVVGASGRTGSLCVNACLRRGIPVRALTRTGEWTSPPTPEGSVTTYDGDTSKLLSVAKCDVASTDATSLAANADALKGCSAVIYAASASKNGGSAYEVDHKGVVTVAEACLQAKVPRCVVISSTGTTRPKSLGYVFTNLGVGGNIMGEKRNGETGLMAAYNSGNPQQQQQTSSPLSYTIIRPGGLEEPKRNKVLGPSSLEISQGDVFAGIISRADVAEITVELALSNAPNVRNTAIELYYKDSVVEVEGRFKKLLADTKQQENSDNKLRLQGSTYSELLEGIRSGIDYTE